jgi:hypothetical protein
MSKEAMMLARQIIWRYRHETPLGNQPHMIAHEADEAIEKIDQALAKQEQSEPMAWMVWGDNNVPSLTFTKPADKYVFDALYTTPQQRTWVGLTDEESNELWESTDSDWELMKRTEAKLKEKNT